MTDTAALLAAYDDQLRTDAEVQSADAVTRIGPLYLATFRGERGFITYRDLGDADAEQIAALVRAAREHFESQPAISRVEWKTRGHDHAPGLPEALLDNGFHREDTESILIGEAARLAVDIPVLDGVTLRRVTTTADLEAMNALHATVFGGDGWAPTAADDLAKDDGSQLWIAVADGQVVSTGRLEPVAGTDFAGLWGGATLPQWRGRGIYRALTAARARAALDAGIPLVQVDCTEYSRPILERSGLVTVSTTTPYLWRR